MRRWWRPALLVLLLVASALAVRRSTARIGQYRSAERVCAAVEAGDSAGALAASSAALPPTVAGLRTSDCRCVALMETGRRRECIDLLERQLAAPEARDWLPRPMLTAVVVESRRQRGDLPGARRLATQGVDKAPAMLPLLVLEANLRLQLEDPRSALEAMARRLPNAGEGALRLRFLLALEAIVRDQWELAASVLGDQPPLPPHHDLWFQFRAQTLAHLGRRQELLDTVESWEKTGPNPARARANYAYLLSTTQQSDPRGREVLKMLAEATQAGDRLGDPDLLKGVYIRYVATLAVLGRNEEAIRAFDEGAKRFGSLEHLDRSDLLRTSGPEAASQEPTGAALAFEVEAPRPGDHLLLSPGADEPHDAQYRRLAVPPSGAVTSEQRFGTSPLRWVLRDGAGAVRGSGAVWPSPGSGPGGSTLVRVARRPPATVAAAPRSPRPAAGRRRLFVVILDCGEWRFVRYGMARDELPTLAALERQGVRGVLLSQPAFTAVAVRSIARPGARRVDGVLGVLHQMGAEVAGLNFVGSNPLGGLAWLLPGAADLFDTLGAGDLQTANLLHSYGGLQVGRHGELTGPHGARGAVVLAASRPLRPDEETLLERQPDADYDRLLAEMAADFDNAVMLAGPGGPDLVVLRVASLDLMTHGAFPATAAAGQDDGQPLLFRIYRYMDRRLGEIYGTLDGNDVLVVMSDHGIRTALQHDPQAMFLAAGGGGPSRLPGQPEIRGVPRMIADFFGVDTTWPATGVEGWVHAATPDQPASAAAAPGPRAGAAALTDQQR